MPLIRINEPSHPSAEGFLKTLQDDCVHAGLEPPYPAPDPNCKLPGCFGRGYIGFREETGSYLPCRCIFRDPNAKIIIPDGVLTKAVIAAGEKRAKK